jgi:hypothetical protein
MYFSFRKPFLHSNAMSLIFIIPPEINSLKCKFFPLLSIRRMVEYSKGE